MYDVRVGDSVEAAEEGVKDGDASREDHGYGVVETENHTQGRTCNLSVQPKTILTPHPRYTHFTLVQGSVHLQDSVVHLANVSNTDRSRSYLSAAVTSRGSDLVTSPVRK